MKWLAVAVVAAGVSAWAPNASATVYTFSVAENGGPTYGFDLDSTTGVSPGVTGLTTNFSNVAYTIDGVAAGSTLVKFNGRTITTDPFTLIVSGILDLNRFAAGAGSTVSFPTGTFSAIDFATVVPVDGFSTDNVTLKVSTISAVTEAVPEPSTWATMVSGFGMLGYAMRRRRKVITNLSFA